MYHRCTQIVSIIWRRVLYIRSIDKYNNKLALHICGIIPSTLPIITQSTRLISALALNVSLKIGLMNWNFYQQKYEGKDGNQVTH